MIMSSVGLLQTKASPGVEEIKKELNGNVCRCGTYPRIVAAVRMAAQGGKNA
jgi:aerobic-type carbon monoxide dehydrogenase small subunit (CoxS/CutS family)